jgi:hypothetical protein
VRLCGLLQSIYGRNWDTQLRLRDRAASTVCSEDEWKFGAPVGPPRAVTNGRIPNSHTRRMHGDENFVSSRSRDRQSMKGEGCR